MKKKSPPKLTLDDVKLFRTSVQGVRILPQEKWHHHSPKADKKNSSSRLQQKRQDMEYFYFSDEFQPLLSHEGPARYLRPGVSHLELKKLRRGDYTPEFFLDLHGFTQAQAKREIAALILACHQKNVLCACIMHGHGKNILKKNLPSWLAQHPHILALHQAPKAFGGNAALLILVEQIESLLNDNNHADSM